MTTDTETSTTGPVPVSAETCAAAAEDVRARLTALEGFDGTPDIPGFLGPLDDLVTEIDEYRATSSLMSVVHPQAEVRDAYEECERLFAEVGIEIGLSRPLYDRVVAVDVAGEDAETRYAHQRMVEDYRRSGVDRDEETRARIRALQEELVSLGQQFGRTIADDVRTLYVEDPARLDGLPEDFIAGHPPGEDGRIAITTNYPDLVPVMTYAHDDQLRHDLRVLSRSRGYPDNVPVLEGILEKRFELANLLGFDTWADFVIDNKMAGSPETVQAFVDRVMGIVQGPAEVEKAALLEELRKTDPQAEQVQAWQNGYLAEKIRQGRFDVDSKEVRQYFDVSRVKQGIFQLVEDLYGLSIRPWQTEVWHPSVEAYEVFDGGEKLGRFYLDLYPREGKYKHAAVFTVRPGRLGRDGAAAQFPANALVTNFPDPGTGNALMEHGQVETFLHEFGHLIHNMVSGRHKWANISGLSMEWDFVEAPSMMLEEWAWDAETLRTFAVNAAGEPIPEDLVARMNAARHFGGAINTQTQLYYTAISLDFYNADPATFELEPKMAELAARYNPFPLVPGTHFYTNFGHLDGYSAIYYTYQWSLAIGLDMFSRFEAEGLRNHTVARQYLDQVLTPGGARPAKESVEAFLGRPYSLDAYERRLNLSADLLSEAAQ